MNIVIIQPPLVQLNTPYPAGAYLSSFFRRISSERGISGSVIWHDLSEELFHEIFCREGLTRLFELSSGNALAMARKAERDGDDNTAFQLRRYVSEQDAWCIWIERIIDIACGSKGGHEYVHEFIRSAFVPRGSRMEQYLASIGREPAADDAEVLASLALADLADYITAAFDHHFALIRYAESIACSTSDFADVEHALDSPVLTQFYRPLLERKISKCESGTLFCISVPFPGTFASAVYTARFIRERYGSNAVIGLGGGYVNTELRSLNEKKLFRYFDFISYDRGYGSFLSLFDGKMKFDGTVYYKVRYLYDGLIIGSDACAGGDETYIRAEDELTRTLVPDYSDIDFSRYPHLADTSNPMQRIWSDGTWMKVYLAYGCYWHRCEFCDTTLEYVNRYCMTDVRRLFDGLRCQAQKTGVYGLHFVDEACPPAALEKFALINCGGTKRFTFWGNIRFEKSFTRDLADLLSYGGMTGVSAGIEIATGGGLDAVNKGTTMENIVAACCAFKEAGILVHSYMIYGFWNQSEQDVIDSMETLRQLFAAGLLDSAFWHKFTLTRHSTVYREWEEGKHPDLVPLPGRQDAFAENDVRFEGEKKSARYGEALNASLESWMNGEEIDKSVTSWFAYAMPEPSVKKDYIASLIAVYEKKRDSSFNNDDGSGSYVWLGGKPAVLESSDGKQLCWTYMGELVYADVKADKAQSCAEILYAARPGIAVSDGETMIQVLGRKLFKELRGKGLCRL